MGRSGSEVYAQSLLSKHVTRRTKRRGRASEESVIGEWFVERMVDGLYTGAWRKAVVESMWNCSGERKGAPQGVEHVARALSVRSKALWTTRVVGTWRSHDENA